MLATLFSHMDKTRGQKTPLRSDSFLTSLPNTTPFYVTRLHTTLLLLGWLPCQTKADLPHQLAPHFQQRQSKLLLTLPPTLPGVRGGSPACSLLSAFCGDFFWKGWEISYLTLAPGLLSQANLKKKKKKCGEGKALGRGISLSSHLSAESAASFLTEHFSQFPTHTVYVQRRKSFLGVSGG